MPTKPKTAKPQLTARDMKLLEAIRQHPEKYQFGNEKFRESPGIQRLMDAGLLTRRAFPIVIAACYSPNDADGKKYHRQAWSTKTR